MYSCNVFRIVLYKRAVSGRPWLTFNLADVLNSSTCRLYHLCCKYSDSAA